jgi:hypothetical protein
MALDTECWEWVGARTTRGYGTTTWEGKQQYVHRLVMDAPSGLTVDHLCFNPSCYNPRHLELVSDWENRARGRTPAGIVMRTGKCQRGHEMNKSNVYVKPNGMKNCRECMRQAVRRYREKKDANVSQ